MEMTTAKTVAVFAIIFGCFAVLYPKIFQPMLLHMVTGNSRQGGDELLDKVPPHLRKGVGASPRPASPAEDISRQMRAGPHPGLRAAAEMKKHAAPAAPGAGKGMMGVVLPMYAVGIVIYLIYTMSKVFGGKKDSDQKDYLSTHFQDVRQGDGANKEAGPEEEGIEESLRKSKRNRRDLERLLLKADKNDISEIEMRELKRRLLETEEQMTRILSAMDTVSQKVGDVTEQVVKKPGSKQEKEDEEEEEQEEDDEPGVEEEIRDLAAKITKSAKSVDLSPDMESYEIINGSDKHHTPTNEQQQEQPAKTGGQQAGEDVENIGPACDGNSPGQRPAEGTGDNDAVNDDEDADTEADRVEPREQQEEELSLDAQQDEKTDDDHPDLRRRMPHEKTKEEQ